jgi:hypothetical protein
VRLKEMSISSILYEIGRTASKAGSLTNDAKNLKNGRVDKVLEKRLKREVHKNLNSILRKF